MKNVLVTGGAGFIGSNFIKMLMESHPNLTVVNLDALTYAGNYHNVENLPSNHTFVKGSICNAPLLNSLFDKYAFDVVVNFAAESHVDRSISNPSLFVETNVLGTQTLLDVCKSHWNLNPEDKHCKEYADGVRYLQISTDEVYGTLGSEGKFHEYTPLSPNSPYSASKASADMLVRAYHQTFGFPSVTTRCSNNYGPNQFPEKLIPLTISRALKGQKIQIYGNGLQIRDWIHVSDHCKGVETVLKKGIDGEVYNIGCENEWTNIDIVTLILSELGASETLIEHVKDRPGHDVRYAMDNHKIRTELGWKPELNFEKGIEQTINWYLENTEWIKNIESGEYLAYANRINQ